MSTKLELVEVLLEIVLVLIELSTLSMDSLSLYLTSKYLSHLQVTWIVFYLCLLTS